jgi:predicted deacetylase
MTRPALVVSLHDVSPRTAADFQIILRELAELGVAHTSLLVIPDHHHRGHMLADPAFGEWLRGLAKAGHEVVMHGYFHQRERRAGESARDRWTTRVYTADEGEFYDLNAPEAAALVERARADFHQLGLDPTGFIAPAWLLSPGSEDALRTLGCAYTTRLGSILDLAENRQHDSQSLVWSVRSGWRRQVSLAWNAFLRGRLRANPLLRISIHPVDLHHPRIWQQIREFVAAALADREALTYQAWLARWRQDFSSSPSSGRDRRG